MSTSLETFRARVARLALARMKREGLTYTDLQKQLSVDRNRLWRALNPSNPHGEVGADTLFALIDWLGEDAGELVQPRVTTTYRQVEDAIENLADVQITKDEREQMIGHIRLVRANSLRRERGAKDNAACLHLEMKALPHSSGQTKCTACGYIYTPRTG